MKNHFKKLNLIGLSLLGTFLMVCIINITSGQTSIPTKIQNFEHKIRLHSLFLWDGPSDDHPLSMKINTGDDFLSIEGGLAIGSNHNTSSGTTSSAIGGGINNYIDGQNSGIAGGSGNKIDNSMNSFIGGGSSNSVNSDNAVIGGGKSNTIQTNSSNSIIIGGEYNNINGENSIILGGKSNETLGRNSLVFGQNSKGETGSFVFNLGNSETPVVGKENSARIDAKSGVLIGTLYPTTGVKLVVSGAVSLTGNSELSGGVGGEIKVVDGCIYAYDGSNRKIMGKSSANNNHCGEKSKTCQFGEAILYQGDQVDAYTNFWNNDCSSIREKATCSGGNLVDINNITKPYFPYCYTIGG